MSLYSEYYLKHYGIKGMKWGVRRYQNEDGTLTPAGKKRLAKAVSSSAKGNTVEERHDLERSIGADLLKKGVVKEETINDLHNKRLAYASTFKPEYDYWDSGEAAKDSAKAYEETLEWFRKNDKKFLDEIVKLNGGSEEGLDMYHGFRKAYEGYEDEAWTKGQKRFEQSLKEKGIDLKAIEKAQDKAWDDYSDACKRVADDIVGKYGNMSASRMNEDYSYLKTNVHGVVENAIRGLEMWGLRDND